MKDTIMMQAKLQGEFRLQVYRPDGRCREDTGFFPNLITDIGLDRIGTNADYLTYAGVGSGNTTPQFTDTGLAVPVARTSTTQSSSGTAQSSSPFFATLTITKRFPVGAAAGNLQEVSIQWADDNASAFSRALILDGGGAPTSITVLSDEFLDVTYQSRIIIPETDSVQVITVNKPEGPVQHTLTLRAAKASTFITNGTGWGMAMAAVPPFGQIGFMNVSTLGAITGDLSQVRANNAGVTVDPYVTGSKQRRFIMSWGPTEANGDNTGISIQLTGSRWQVGISPALTKTSVQSFSLPFIFSWDRA